MALMDMLSQFFLELPSYGPAWWDVVCMMAFATKRARRISLDSMIFKSFSIDSKVAIRFSKVRLSESKCSPHVPPGRWC